MAPAMRPRTGASTPGVLFHRFALLAVLRGVGSLPVRDGSSSPRCLYFLLPVRICALDACTEGTRLPAVAVQLLCHPCWIRMPDGVPLCARSKDRPLPADELFRTPHLPRLGDGAVLFADRADLSPHVAGLFYVTDRVCVSSRCAGGAGAGSNERREDNRESLDGNACCCFDRRVRRVLSGRNCGLHVPRAGASAEDASSALDILPTAADPRT